MKQEPSHWSERARLGLPSLPPSRSRRKRPSKRNPSKALFITAACVFCVGAAAAGLVWYFTSAGDDSGAQTASSTNASTQDTDDTGSSTSSPGSAGSTSTASTSTHSVTTASTSIPSTSTTSTATTSSSGESADASDATVFYDETVGFSFEYPTSWVELPLEEVIDLVGPPTVGIAVGDQLGAKSGTSPADYIFFGAYEDPSQPAPPARAAMEEWVALAEPESPQPLTTIEPITDFEVNGVSGASRTYSLEDQGRPLIKRISFLSAGTCIHIFTFCAEEQEWDTYEVLFDAALNSFTVTINE